MIKYFLTVFSILVLFTPLHAATYTVCASGCNETTIQDAFDNNDLGADDVIEVRADTPGGTKTYTERVVWGSDDSGTGVGNEVILQGRSGDTVKIDGTAYPGIRTSENSYIIIQDLELLNGGGSGGYVGQIHLVDAAYVIVRRNYIHDGNGSPSCDGIFIHGGNNVTIEQNLIQNHRCNTSSDSIQFYNSGGGHIIRYNFLDNDRSGCILSGRDSGSLLWGAEIYGNVLIPQEYQGIRVTNFRQNVSIYNNTFIVEASGPSSIYIYDDSSDYDLNIKNNIFVDAGAYPADYAIDNNDSNSTNFDFNYNVYYSTASHNVISSDDTYTCAEFSDYQNDESQDADSYCENPDMVDRGNRDFTLAAGSPAIGNGDTVVAAAYQILDPSSTWPDGVVLVDNSDADIGAYAYTADDAPSACDRFVDADADPGGDGSFGDPWDTWSDATGASAGDIVCFDTRDDWGGSGSSVFVLKAGVTYLGNEWPTPDTDCSDGGCARLYADGAQSGWEMFVEFNTDHATEETVLQGFDVDCTNRGYASIISIGENNASEHLTEATKRVRDCYIHDNDPNDGEWDYGILIGSKSTYDISNVEILNNTVANIDEEGIMVYPAAGSDNDIDNVLIRGNNVSNTGVGQSGFGWGIGWWNRGDGSMSNVVIEFNYIHGNPTAGVNLGALSPVSGGIVRYNIITDSGNAIYIQQSGQQQFDIYGNLIFSNSGGDYSNGAMIFVSDFTSGSNNVKIYNNSFYNNEHSNDIYVSSSANFSSLIVSNNIVPGGISDSGSEINTAQTNRTSSGDYKNTSNLPSGFSGAYGTDLVPNQDGLSVESGISSNGGTDLGGSPFNGAINFSGGSNGYTRDSNGGSGWDIGAYEHEGVASIIISNPLPTGSNICE